MKKDDDHDEPEGYVGFGEPGSVDEDGIVGDRAGLARLAEHIAEALENGSSEITDPGIDFSGVRVLVEGQSEPRPTTWKDRLLGLGCSLFGLGIVFVFGLGVHRAWEWIFG